jgi:hypothetical protein
LKFAFKQAGLELSAPPAINEINGKSGNQNKKDNVVPNQYETTNKN